MNGFTLTKTRIQSGIWEGVLTANSNEAQDVPELVVSHLEQPIHGVDLAEASPGEWHLRIPVPPELLSDGVQTFVITNKNNDEKLGHFTIITGEPLEDDLRAEVDLLREELDLLKKAFRRHCREVTNS